MNLCYSDIVGELHKAVSTDAGSSQITSCRFQCDGQRMIYRLFENLDIWFPLANECEGKYDLPNWLPFSYAHNPVGRA